MVPYSRARNPHILIEPSSSQTPIGTSPARILLVEEYKALAVAFGSALRKFAPGSATRVVNSLAEAEQLFAEFKPTLLVIDCDPPPLQSVQFFERLRLSLPDARVLIVAAENAGEFSGRETIPLALEFIKKPFELEKFGSVIERLLLLDPPLTGTLRNLQLLDLILLYAITASAMILRVTSTGGRSGEIHFAEGRMVHAAAMGKSGIDALKELLSWRFPRFSESQSEVNSPRTIHRAWPLILREALPGVSANPTPEEPPRPSKSENIPVLPTTKIVVVDDTELLLDLLEEVLVAAHPELEIISAQTGFDGLTRAANDKPDLLLLDYDLPDITGADVCEKLLENNETARIPVLMMSGHVAEMTAAAERFGNVVATIEKPFLSAVLVDLVQRTLRDLPKLRLPFTKKISFAPTSQPEPTSRNGNEAATKPVGPPKIWAHESLAGLAEEHIPESMLDPSPAIEQEIEEAAEASKTSVSLGETNGEKTETPEIEATLDAPGTTSAGLAARARVARSNAVVLGLPLEVLDLKLSPRLRVTEIRARSFSSNVSLHVLSRSLPGLARRDAPFRLTNVQLNRTGQFDFISVEPAPAQKTFRPARYDLKVEGAELLPAKGSETIQLKPNASGSMRLELLALFELQHVELSTDFSVQHLLLKLRDPRMRVTLLPEAVHVGATFTVAHCSRSASGAIDEIRLVAL